MVLPFLALLLPILPCLSCLSTANSLKSKSSNKTKNETNNADTETNDSSKDRICRNPRVQPIIQPVVHNFEPLQPIFNLPPANTKPITLFEVNEFHGKYNSIRY